MKMDPTLEAVVNCDLCEAPMQLPPGAIRHGKIIGLLVCTQCVEDTLATRQLEMQS